MAVLTEPDEYPDGIYQIELTDPVVGGAPNEATGAGIVNIPHWHLAKRTRWLKNRVDALLALVVDATTAAKGVVQLSTSVVSTSTTTAATSSAVKTANDNANSRVPAARQVLAGGIATGGGAIGAADVTITVTPATQAEAQAGADNTRAMTPLRAAQAIAHWFQGRTVLGGGLASVSGLLRDGNVTVTVPVASQAEAQAGADHTKAMTAYRVAQAIAAQVPAATGLVAGLVRLSNSVGSTATDWAATPAAVKAANDNANGRVPNARTVTGSGLAAGGGALAGNVVINVPAASQALAEGGVNDATAMTPARTYDAIVRRTPGWGQTWTKQARSVGVWYQNTTGRPMTVMITSSAGHRIHLGSSPSSYIVHDESGSTVNSTQATFVVPANHYYRITESAGASLDVCELR